MAFKILVLTTGLLLTGCAISGEIVSETPNEVSVTHSYMPGAMETAGQAAAKACAKYNKQSRFLESRPISGNTGISIFRCQ